MHAFMENMRMISSQLKMMEGEYSELYKEYEGESFDGQTTLAIEIENLILMLTYELASQIDFGIRDLDFVVKYVDFREAVYEYTDQELETILENQKKLTVKQMRELTEGKTENNIPKLINKWKESFGDRSFQQFKNTIF